MTETVEHVREALQIALAAANLDEVAQKAKGHKPYAINVRPNEDVCGDGLLGEVQIDAFTIYPVKSENISNSIKGQIRTECVKWQVDVAVPTPYSRWEPPDADISEIGQYNLAAQAAKEVVMLLVKDRIEGALQATNLADHL